MRTESHSTVPHLLEATENKPLEEPQKFPLMEPKHQDTSLANDIKATCINTCLIPALSMDVWLAFDLRSEVPTREYD